MDKRHVHGLTGEDYICQWLEAKGYEILARRWKQTGFAELDILARRESSIWIVEVKAHEAPVFGSLLSDAQMKRLKKARFGLLLQFPRHSIRIAIAWVKLSSHDVEFFEIP